MVHTHIYLYFQIPPKFWQITHFLITHNQHLRKIGCGIFIQEPFHKLDEHKMKMFWAWCLPSPPVWCLCSSCIYLWQWIRVWNSWHCNVTRKLLIGLTTSPFYLAVLGGPVVPMILSITLPWHGDRIQKLFAPHILNQTSQISHGESSWSFICEIIGSKPLVKEQSSLFQYFPSDLGTPNMSELGLDSLHRRVVQHPPYLQYLII